MPARDHEYWIRIAEEDRTVIRNEFAAPEKVWRIVVFLAQSAAEKYLKAFLAFNDTDPERTHDMDELLTKCTEFDPSLKVLVEDCGNLSPFSVDARYPEFEGVYDEDSARRAVAASERICNAIRGRIR
jgi:HEPN domain-containing protein